METVSYIVEIKTCPFQSTEILFCRFYKPWESLIIRDASVAVFAMNAWTGFHLLLTSIIKSTV
jgi:hypothetical protein